ncbi:type II toxin-antitoxin system VapC family toxin [Candidatus Thiothrix anitrata]|uniref:Type II toxin-antitoxin system VapC family toxin n=1 Tax=Candidatus Thiothrix anitrata TaxID=2823902 RepID=A0ABX7WZY2_9GAMM|nr:type II toxin-antitoxin system VapC family toxin [Candidatus Thiothrix anitrata]QTR48717.1 type II toxin-antitoxin system VapC family toxin [Candidatus Thiothrix anitrata]
MILVDTSVWIDHLRVKEERLTMLLGEVQVCMHPMVWGELACGNLKNRPTLLRLWQGLPVLKQATHTETMYCLEQRKLMGKGIGYVDLHLLTAVLLSPGTQLWTRDKRLRDIAIELGCGWQESH